MRNRFWKFFESGSKESMTRLMSFALIVIGVLLSLYSAFLATVGMFDMVFAGFVLALIGAALTGKVQGARVENKKDIKDGCEEEK